MFGIKSANGYVEVVLRWCKNLTIGITLMMMFCNSDKYIQVVKYKEGQVWTYKTRQFEERSKIYIVKVEKYPKINFVYHIYIDSLKIKNSLVENGMQTYLPHIPVSEETLDSSVIELADSNQTNLPDITDGYNEWKKAKGGVFTISASKIISYIEDIVYQTK